MPKDPICHMEVSTEEALPYECEGQQFYFCSEGCRQKFLMQCKHHEAGEILDLIIVGGGPAGLTAATFASTLKLRAFLIAKDLGGQAIDSTKIENYMGFDFITGPELVARFQRQLLHSHYIDHLLDEVVQVKLERDGFQVTTLNEATLHSRALIVATGMTRKKLGIPGEETFQRRGIFYCNIPDYSFVEGKDVAVIGGGNSAVQIVENLASVARSIHLMSTSSLNADAMMIERIRKIHQLSILEGCWPLEFKGDKRLSQLRAKDLSTHKTLRLNVQGVFIAIGLHPNTALVEELVKLNDQGEIIIQPDCATSVPGLYAAGDVSNSFGKRIIIASGEGAKAALAAKAYLIKTATRGGGTS